MYRLYLDIRERLGDPLWHDDQGVPRYVPYHPQHGGIYDRWSALLEIACQGCQRRFLVADGYSPMDFICAGWKPSDPLEPDMPSPTNAGGSFSFGDAPWHEGDGGQCAGTTMTTDTIRIVEFWTRDGGPSQFDWRRRPDLEFVYDASAVRDGIDAVVIAHADDDAAWEPPTTVPPTPRPTD